LKEIESGRVFMCLNVFVCQKERERASETDRAGDIESKRKRSRERE